MARLFLATVGQPYSVPAHAGGKLLRNCKCGPMISTPAADAEMKPLEQKGEGHVLHHLTPCTGQTAVAPQHPSTISSPAGEFKNANTARATSGK